MVWHTPRISLFARDIFRCFNNAFSVDLATNDGLRDELIK